MATRHHRVNSDNLTPDKGPIFHEISHDNNMGVVRYILCLSVILMHTNNLTGTNLPLIINGTVAVGGFFALSGFLLFASFQKKATLKHYFSRRARRILPPYFLIVLLCAICFSSISSMTAKEYYSDSGFWKYLAANLSFLNFIHNELPGVFQGPQFIIPVINGSLWTMKGEWVCYASVPLLFWFIGHNRKRASITFIILILVGLLIAHALYNINEHTGLKIYATFAKQFRGLFTYFFCGALINLAYDKFLKYKWGIIIVSLAIVLTCDYNPLYYTIFQPIVVSTIVIWVSQVGKWGTFLKNHDDLSYDMYLFHFPIIQLTNYYGLSSQLSPYALVGVIIAFSFIFSLLSWNVVGKHILHRHNR